MTREEAREFLIGISYKLGNMAVEYLTEKDGKKMREAIKALEQEPIYDELRAEITTLQNRCYALTKGTMCAFCKYECEYKAESEPQESEDKCKNCKYYLNPDYTRCHECKAESER